MSLRSHCCCYTYSIYSLGPQFKRLWFHDAGCGHLHIRTRSGKPAVLEMEDATFVFSFPFTVDSGPRPIVYYTWSGSRFAMDERLMRKAVDVARFEKACRLDADLYSIERCLINLLYTGHTDYALRLVKASPQHATPEFLAAFFQTFRRSPNYYRIVELNNRRLFAQLEKLASGAASKAR